MSEIIDKKNQPASVVEVRDDLMAQLHKLAHDQLSTWPLARDNYRSLKMVREKTLTVGGLDVKVQFNPSRAISSKAKTDPDSISQRPCFLCGEHRPKEQMFIGFEGSKQKKYHIQVNPYPVFPEHFVIPSDVHTPQSIHHRATDILTLARRYSDFTFIYNGPFSGASAPDHCHFQAFPSRKLPLENEVREGRNLEYISAVQEAKLFRYTRFARGIFVISGRTRKSVAKMLYRLLDCAPVLEGESEPRFNLFCYRSEDGGYHCIVVLRRCHRSSQYFSADPVEHLAMSPGCVDVGGVFITVERSDFEKLSGAMLEKMMDEVSISKEDEALVLQRLTRAQKPIEVELFRCPFVEFEIVSDGALRRRACFSQGRIEYGGILYDELYFEAKTLSTLFAEASFIIHPEGEKEESLSYAGALRIVVDGEELKVLNVIGVEDYLLSAVSSSMPFFATDEELREVIVKLREKLLCDPCATPPAYSGLVSPPREDVKRAVDASWGVTGNAR